MGGSTVQDLPRVERSAYNAESAIACGRPVGLRHKCLVVADWSCRIKTRSIKAHEPDLTRRGINQNIGRLHVLVNQLTFVQPAECGCETDGEAQEPRHFHRAWKESIESFAARVFEHEHRLTVLLGKDKGPNC